MFWARCSGVQKGNRPGLYWPLALSTGASGPVAQLGARLNRTQEVRGSNPLRSTLSVPQLLHVVCVSSDPG